jgi:hypothetical protein
MNNVYSKSKFAKFSADSTVGRDNTVTPWTLAKLSAARHIKVHQRLFSDHTVSPPRPGAVGADEDNTPFKIACKGLHAPALRESLPTVVRYYTSPVYFTESKDRVFLPSDGSWRDICLLGPFVYDADRATDHLVTRNYY